MPRPFRIAVTQINFDAGTVRYLEERGCEVMLAELPPIGDRDLDHDTLLRILQGADGWIVGHGRATRALMEALPGLKVIARRGVGYERVDWRAARDLGKTVCIAAGGNNDAVADHTLALMLAVGHLLRPAQAALESGDWKIRTGHSLYGKTVGIVGLGRIGRSLVARLQGFAPRILAVSRSRDAGYAAANGITYCDLDRLLAESDYVSLHAPLSDDTRFLIGADQIARMKPGAILVNTARGGLVDDRALLEALRRGHLFGAGLDTFASEADPSFAPVTEALVALPNVVATPHAAASSQEGLVRTNRVAADCVLSALQGGEFAPGTVITSPR